MSQDSFSVLTDGDEVSGLAALNEFIESLLIGPNSIGCSITFALGNIEAAKQGRRFLEKDLDRCFGTISTALMEERIAREYERWLSLSDYHLDIHQTIEASSSAFFVGPESPTLQNVALQISEKLLLICFPQGGFSNQGTPLDDYLSTQNKIGLTLELGQKGFDESQILLGKMIMMNFLKCCGDGFDRNLTLESSRLLYKKAVILNSDQRDATLRSGIQNLTPLKKGEKIGESSLGNILCPEDGFALFPKNGEIARVSSEICLVVG